MLKSKWLILAGKKGESTMAQLTVQVDIRNLELFQSLLKLRKVTDDKRIPSDVRDEIMEELKDIVEQLSKD